MGIDDFDVSWWLYDKATTTRLQVFPMSADAGHDKAMNGPAQLAFAANDPAVDVFLGSTLGQEFDQVTLRMYLRGSVKWVGAASSAKLSNKGDIRSGDVGVTLEHMWTHLNRRRAVYGSTSLGATDKTIEADNLALTVQRENLTGTVKPTGHPGTRTDFGAFNVAVAANHGPALAPSTRLLEQSGNNLASLIDEFFERTDLRPIITESPLNTFTVDNDYPYQETDKSATVVFGQYRGNMPSFELLSDRVAVANIWAVEGASAGTLGWASDATSISLWGEMEAFAQKPQDSAVSADATNEATFMKEVWGSARVSYKAELTELPGMLFGQDWWWADVIALDDAVFGIRTTQVVTGWHISQQDGRLYKLDVLAGIPRSRQFLRELGNYAGMAGPQFAGSRWRNKRQ